MKNLILFCTNLWDTWSFSLKNILTWEYLTIICIYCTCIVGWCWKRESSWRLKWLAVTSFSPGRRVDCSSNPFYSDSRSCMQIKLRSISSEITPFFLDHSIDHQPFYWATFLNGHLTHTVFNRSKGRLSMWVPRPPSERLMCSCDAPAFTFTRWLLPFSLHSWFLKIEVSLCASPVPDASPLH